MKIEKMHHVLGYYHFNGTFRVAKLNCAKNYAISLTEMKKAKFDNANFIDNDPLKMLIIICFKVPVDKDLLIG